MDQRIVTGTDRDVHFFLLKGQEQLTNLNGAGEKKIKATARDFYFF
jgi:hypothetical protein